MTSLQNHIVATTAALNSILLEQTQYLESLPMNERIELLMNRDSRCIAQYLESLPMNERIEVLRNRDSRCIDLPL